MEKSLRDDIQEKPTPLILAPAGSRQSFFAGLAAGADAIYCGLKQYSARMEAKNFSEEELQRLTEMAHENGVAVYIAMNAVLKPSEVLEAGKTLDRLQRYVRPDGIIIQDLGFLQLARQTGFEGDVHLSTLSNVSFSSALKAIRHYPEIRHVVLPRELNIDEIKTMAVACPEGVKLEVFIHGALCYAVSGRCYWSSFLGGKSGLRGRCVQPCRRQYRLADKNERFFSCNDLSIDVLAKTLRSIPKVGIWKIEGRKKSPHYVYYTVMAYKLLRDMDKIPGGRGEIKKSALGFLQQALGREGTHYNFLPQRPFSPLQKDGHTASGLYAGSVKGGQEPFLIPRMDLLAEDVLRIGYEDQTWHTKIRLKRFVPKGGRFVLPVSSKRKPKNGSAVFIVDRREKELVRMIERLQKKSDSICLSPVRASGFRVVLPTRNQRRIRPRDVTVYRNLPEGKRGSGKTGFWLSAHAGDVQPRYSPADIVFLPPVIWPGDEKEIRSRIRMALEKGIGEFVLNGFWQQSLFPDISKKLRLWAGPFCNITNPLTLQTLSDQGYAGAVVSPELSGKNFLELAVSSPIPIGVVIAGLWPLCVSRIAPQDIPQDRPFSSPKGEQAWVHQHGKDFWVFPNWGIDLRSRKEELTRAGYSLFLHFIEPTPRGIKLKDRKGEWNWKHGME